MFQQTVLHTIYPLVPAVVSTVPQYLALSPSAILTTLSPKVAAAIMRLLNTGTLRIVHFPNPPYATLSHVCQGDEASYQDIHALRAHPDPLYVASEKVRRFCAFARAEGFEWAWLDACCIDKTSSSELSEALNSMFRWYRDAVVCYAFLHDVPDC